jgi:hypothetical protein
MATVGREKDRKRSGTLQVPLKTVCFLSASALREVQTANTTVLGLLGALPAAPMINCRHQLSRPLNHSKQIEGAGKAMALFRAVTGQPDAHLKSVSRYQHQAPAEDDRFFRSDFPGYGDLIRLLVKVERGVFPVLIESESRLYSLFHRAFFGQAAIHTFRVRGPIVGLDESRGTSGPR